MTRTIPPIPAEAEAPPDLLTPLTESAACFGGARQRFEFAHGWQFGIDQFEVGKIVRQLIGIGETRKFVLGRRARHGNGPRGEGGGAIIRDVVGRDHRLAAADQHAQPEIVAFRAFRLFNLSVAQLDRERHPAYRDGVGSVRPGGACGLDQAVGALG